MISFTLELWKKSYIDDVVKYADNKNIAKNLRDTFPFPYSYEDAVWYVNDCIEKGCKKQLTRAIVVDGRAVGSVGVFVKEDVYQKSAEIGYWLGEPFWGKGIMHQAVRQICQEAFLTFDIIRIFAEPFAHNIGSKRTLEKAGFSFEGIMKQSVYKYGEIFDSCMYALLKTDYEKHCFY